MTKEIIEHLLDKQEPLGEPFTSILHDNLHDLYETDVDFKSQVVSGFYEERVPQFRQGYPTHELEDVVTAEEVTGYVERIEKLRKQMDSLVDEDSFKHWFNTEYQESGVDEQWIWNLVNTWIKHGGEYNE